MPIGFKEEDESGYCCWTRHRRAARRRPSGLGRPGESADVEITKMLESATRSMTASAGLVR